MTPDLTIAVLTDIHGNGFAAEAVAANIRRAQPDLTVNLGDQVYGQARPDVALEVQRSLNAVEVRGNNDERLLFTDAQEAGEGNAWRRTLRRSLTALLPADEVKRLATLPTDVLLAGGEVLATHGTPGSPWDSLLWGFRDRQFWPRSDAEIEARLAGHPDSKVVLVGHGHREQVREWRGRLLVNVGPVAHQNDGGPRARWTLLTRTRGKWSVDMRRVEYDWHAAAAWIRANPSHDQDEAPPHDQPPSDAIITHPGSES